MSRRRRADDPRRLIAIVCTDRGRHNRRKLGVSEIYDTGESSEIPSGAVTFGFTASRREPYSATLHRQSRYAHQVRRGQAVETVTFVCATCGRNVPMSRETWIPRVIALYAVGAQQLDVSVDWDKLDVNSS